MNIQLTRWFGVNIFVEDKPIFRILYGIDKRVRAMVRLLSSDFHFRVKIIAVTLSLRSKRFKNSIWIPYGLKVLLHETIRNDDF